MKKGSVPLYANIFFYIYLFKGLYFEFQKLDHCELFQFKTTPTRPITHFELIFSCLCLVTFSNLAHMAANFALHLTLEQKDQRFKKIFIICQGPLFSQPAAQGQQVQETNMKMRTRAPPDKCRCKMHAQQLPRLSFWLCCFYSRCLSSSISGFGMVEQLDTLP